MALSQQEILDQLDRLKGARRNNTIATYKDFLPATLS